MPLLKIRKALTLSVNKQLNQQGFFLKDITVYRVADEDEGERVINLGVFYPWKQKLQSLVRKHLGDSLSYGLTSVTFDGSTVACKSMFLTMEEMASLCMSLENNSEDDEELFMSAVIHDCFKVLDDFSYWYNKGKGLVCADRTKKIELEEVEHKTKTEVVKTDKQVDKLYSLAGKIQDSDLTKDEKEFLVSMMMNYKKVINLGKRIADFEYLSKDLIRYDKLMNKLGFN